MSDLSPQPAGDAVTMMDRRRSPREARRTAAWLSAAAAAHQASGMNVMVADLSLHGVGFVSDRELKKRDTHWMVIADGQLRLSTRLRIVATRKRDDGQWEIGAEFF